MPFENRRCPCTNYYRSASGSTIFAVIAGNDRNCQVLLGVAVAASFNASAALVSSSSGVAQWLACWAHNPKVRGSKPRSANLEKLMSCQDFPSIVVFWPQHIVVFWPQEPSWECPETCVARVRADRPGQGVRPKRILLDTCTLLRYCFRLSKK